MKVTVNIASATGRDGTAVGLRQTQGCHLTYDRVNHCQPISSQVMFSPTGLASVLHEVIRIAKVGSFTDPDKQIYGRPRQRVTAIDVSGMLYGYRFTDYVGINDVPVSDRTCPNKCDIGNRF